MSVKEAETLEKFFKANPSIQKSLNGRSLTEADLFTLYTKFLKKHDLDYFFDLQKQLIDHNFMVSTESAYTGALKYNTPFYWFKDAFTGFSELGYRRLIPHESHTSGTSLWRDYFLLLDQLHAKFSLFYLCRDEKVFGGSFNDYKVYFQKQQAEREAEREAQYQAAQLAQEAAYRANNAFSWKDSRIINDVKFY